MKAVKLAHRPHRPHHLGYEGSHVMVPLVVISLMALAVYYVVRRADLLEISRNALFDVMMVFVALGIAGLFGAVGAWLRSDGDGKNEGFCFVGALIGAIVFYIALLT
ncbi:hypothetical protein [Trinickia dinghuensis]|uniref:Uncharacterized protein n=1 Tax=Trinickia dinghuensis TaxID=2291023 RepID=A0A3D8JNH9_9BURK|nr:hypothetical protein [Trinickia dinghuensis]RDU94693.1 hypothetical protein DWV00_32640 [Trinickia dinghuensis]